MKTGLLLLWAGVLVGCAAGPDYHEPQRPLPAHFGNARYPSLGEGQVAAQFWTLLNDPTLDGLIADALAANNDLARAADNLEASRAAARLVGFDAYPTIRVGGSYSHALASQHQFIAADHRHLRGRIRRPLGARLLRPHTPQQGSGASRRWRGRGDVA
jgi:outer membrane protein TolC